MNLMQKISVGLLVAAVFAPLAVNAQSMMPPPPMGQMMPHGPEGGPGMRHPMPPVAGMTETQQDKSFAILHAQQPQQRELAKAVHKAREALHALVKGGEFDEKKALALSQALAQAVAALELHEARTHAQLAAVLTPEQRKQLDSERPRHPNHS